MRTATISLTPDNYAALYKISKIKGMDADKLANKAIRRYLQKVFDKEQDELDLKDAIRISKEIDAGRMKTYTSDELKAIDL